MKIVFANDVIYGYATGAAVVGGAERQQWLLARALAAAGWSVTIAVRDGLGAGEQVCVGGVTFKGIGPGNIFSGWYRFLATERPDWWYWRCASHLWGPAVEIARLARVRTIFAAGFDTDVQPSRALVRRPRWWPLYAWGLERTDRVFVQHTGQFQRLPPRWQPKAHLVRSIAGALPTTVTPHAERNKYVAWVGMLRQPKRPDVLAEIARRTPTVRFVVCGGTTSFASPAGYGDRVISTLKALPNIDFLGQVAPTKAHDVIANAAVLLSTSDGEGFPNTFLEAWANGTPVVSLNLDPDAVIEHHQVGTVPGTVDRASADILALIGSTPTRDEMAKRSRQYIESAHSEAAVSAAFERAVFTSHRRRHTALGSQGQTGENSNLLRSKGDDRVRNV